MAKSLVFTRSVYPCFISQQHWNCETASIYLELVKHRYDSNCKKQRKGNANVTITLCVYREFYYAARDLQPYFLVS